MEYNCINVDLTKVDLKNVKFPDVFHQLLDEQCRQRNEILEREVTRKLLHADSLQRCGQKVPADLFEVEINTGRFGYEKFRIEPTSEAMEYLWSKDKVE